MWIWFKTILANYMAHEFDLFSLRLTSLGLSRSFLRFSSWFAPLSSLVSPYPNTSRSSRRISTPPGPVSFSCNLHSNSSGSRLIPNGIFRYLYRLNAVQKVVFLLLSSSNPIWLKPSLASRVVKTFALLSLGIFLQT